MSPNYEFLGVRCKRPGCGHTILLHIMGPHSNFVPPVVVKPQRDIEVRCPKCLDSYAYQPAEVVGILAEEPPPDFVPHPLFQTKTIW
jgi:hypothetical protein